MFIIIDIRSIFDLCKKTHITHTRYGLLYVMVGSNKYTGQGKRAEGESSFQSQEVELRT